MDDVCEDVVLCEHGVSGADVALHHAEETGCGEGLARGLGDLVASDLFGHEAIVGDVRIERVNQVVPISPDVLFCAVIFESFGLSVPDYIHPVTRPFFAVVRAGEETFNEARPGIVGGVGHECIHFLGGWWEAEEVIGGTADKLFFGGARR